MPDQNSYRARTKNRERTHGFQTNGIVKTPMFNDTPWKDPSVPHLRAVSAIPGYTPLPPSYKHGGTWNDTGIIH